MDEPNGREESEGSKKTLDGYVKYSGLAFQMIAIIGICTFAGYKIDEYRQSETLIFSALLGLAGVCIALYIIIRGINKN
ncbi:MAG TPA: AtpZ/AtpI family protein [Sphingobacteriaceae bacterium]|nr:AtpZ/AtpI family protein [Sphingobacteriaceae bacterium]